MTDVDALFAGVVAGDRRMLARAITLCESTRDDDRASAAALLTRVHAHLASRAPGGRSGAVRVGISGTPGVGKSTLIEALGSALVDGAIGGRTATVAVLAVDPSSPTSGGSLLGDKTRMEKLAQHERAFIRPSPSSGALGGTAPHTRDAVLLCEAAGFDVVLVETVGVGQSEASVRDIVDTFVLLVAPGGGDELQGVKRGILELVDVLFVNRGDGSRVEEASRTRRDYEQGARLFLRETVRGGNGAAVSWQVPVLVGSALERGGLDTLWTAITEHRTALEQSGGLQERRARQQVASLWRAVDEAALAEVRALDATFRDALEARVRTGALSPEEAARELLSRVRTARTE